MGYLGNIPLVSVGNSTFTQNLSLIRTYKEGNKDLKQRYFESETSQRQSGHCKLLWNVNGKVVHPRQKRECDMSNLKYNERRRW